MICLLEKRSCGPVVLWSCGPVVLWSCGPVVLWSCGPVVKAKSIAKEYKRLGQFFLLLQFLCPGLCGFVNQLISVHEGFFALAIRIGDVFLSNPLAE